MVFVLFYLCFCRKIIVLLEFIGFPESSSGVHIWWAPSSEFSVTICWLLPVSGFFSNYFSLNGVLLFSNFQYPNMAGIDSLCLVLYGGLGGILATWRPLSNMSQLGKWRDRAPDCLQMEGCSHSGGPGTCRGWHTWPAHGWEVGG